MPEQLQESRLLADVHAAMGLNRQLVGPPSQRALVSPAVQTIYKLLDVHLPPAVQVVEKALSFVELAKKAANSWPDLKPWLNTTDIQALIAKVRQR